MGPDLVIWVIPKVGGYLVKKAGDRLTKTLNKTDIEKAIEAGEKAVKKWEKELSPQQLLFYSAKPDGWNGFNKFLSQYFEHSAVLTELEKPLINLGKPDIEILRTVFQQEAEAKNIPLIKSSLKSWLEIFINAYFQHTNTYIKFQVAKQNYFEQLANWFDDVKFAGISVPGQEVEKSEKLAYIFVMPDVVEDVSKSGGFERDFLLAGTGEKLERELFVNSTGRKFLASELLTQSQSRKFVILGAPGSGKTTLMSYFAVMLAQSILPTPLGKESIPPTPLKKGGYSQENTLVQNSDHYTESSELIPPTPLGKGGYSQENTLVQNSDRYTESSSPLTKGGQGGSNSQGALNKGGYNQENTLVQNSDRYTESSELIPPTPLGKRGYSSGNSVGEIGDRSNESSSPLTKGCQGGSNSQGATILGLDPNTDYLPILIRIRDLARHPDKSILEYARIFAEKTMAVKTLPTGFFEHWLEDGRALILLDGLDEVAEEGKRYDVVRRIENFLGQFDRNRAIITSRPAGYRRDFFRTEEFPHYQMQSFDDEKISAFINNWYDSRFRDKGEAERRKESLRKALDDNDRIKLLARNPLLLTIIALIHRYQAVLPKERYRLYDKAVETLLISWDANKELSSHGKLKYLGLDDLRRLMELLAYWVHTQGNVGNDEGGTLIDKDELTEQLSREIKGLKQVQLYQAKEEAERFVELIRERTGLLNEQGQDCYGFVHKTFQEYLCAEEINYQADNEGDFEIVLDSIREHLHESHWREVLLLLIAQQKPKKVAKAMRVILNHGSEYENWLHRDLLFAGNCLAEDPKGLRSVDSDLVQEILERLVELEVSSEELVGRKVGGQVYQIFCSLYETDFEGQVLEMLKERANLVDEERLLKYRAEFGEKDEVIKILLARLEDDDFEVLGRTAFVLGNLGNSSEKVVSALTALLHYRYLGVRKSAADALSKLSSNSETIVSTLLAWLQNDDSNLRWNGAYALGRLGNSSETIVSALLARLQDDDSAVRGSAANALGDLGNTSETVVSALLALLQDQNFFVRRNAAFTLGKLGNSSERIVNALLVRLKNDHSYVRAWAADALGNLGNSSETVVNSLLPLLQDEDSSVRWRAAEALGNLGNSSETVVNSLLPLLQDEDSFVCWSAAQALGKLGNSSETVINSLLKLLQDEDSIVRWRAAEALGNLGKKSPNILPTIIEWIQQHQDSEYVGRGIDVLWYLFVGKEN